MGKDDECKVVRKGSIQIKMHDGVIRTLFEVRHIPNCKENIISLGTLEDKCKYASENGVMKISKSV